MSNNNDKEALRYHSEGRPGKIEVTATKPCLTAEDLSKAYTPGVAAPCLEIAKNEAKAYDYTSKGNLVGVISNGTAVLGLGNIGALASKPVMEGKGVLFKRFADIDVFDIEVNETTVEGMVNIVKSLEPTFGGINLEDIKAPECFEIERQLIEKMNIPVFHDDQHGTAIIASAAFLNALEISKRDIKSVKVVFSGAGAAAIACARLFFDLGVKKENLLMCDSKGVIYQGRGKGMNIYKDEFAASSSDRKTLAEALVDADAFIGCSARGVLTKEMVKPMAKDPIIFAMANPEPEIFPNEVFEVREDAIMATGRSDFPNQVNNVLGFPFIFRGALDVKATKINSEMKLAAVRALADLAKEDVPDEVQMAYSNAQFEFGKNYLIPKPFDTRVLTRVAPAVAKAAIDSGVAKEPFEDIHAYTAQLEARLGTTGTFMKDQRDRLGTHVKRLGRKISMAFEAGANTRVLEAVKVLIDENQIEPILLGNKEKILKKIESLSLNIKEKVTIVDPSISEKTPEFIKQFTKERQRDGISAYHAENAMLNETYFGSMMVKTNLVDAFMAGPTLNYSDCFLPIMNVIGAKDTKHAAGVYIMIFKNRILFLADCTAQIEPGAEELSEIAASTAKLYRLIMGKEPRTAFLSFSNFGSNNHPKARKVKKAVQITKEKYPNMIVDGELQADVAVNKNILQKLFSFSDLDEDADILIFPELNSANICYKLLLQLSEANAIGPILVPMNNTANIIQRTATVSEIVNISITTAVLSAEEDLAYK